MKKMLLLFALFLWTGMQAVMAQTKARGTVLDENKEPLAGATVKILGTSTGTITDMNGNFEVVIPEGKSGKIEISSAGYAKVVVAASENMAINMEVSSTVLGEAEITVPYGPPVSKERYVGAADNISSKQLEKMPVTDITRAIEGAAPGMQVTNGSGQPGSGANIRIRGTGSLGSNNSPLYVLDGTPYMGDITSINPSDIASISVLKDATATSLYGARGANGVIVINTKKGKKGAARITLDAKMGIVQRGLANYDVISDPSDYYKMALVAQTNKLVANGMSRTDAIIQAAGLGSGQGIADLLGSDYVKSMYGIESYQLFDSSGRFNPNAKLKYQDNWLKELQRTGLRQDYNLNVSGGNEATDYFLSFGYLKEDAYTKYSGYDRFTARLNLNTQVNSWLKAGMNLSGALSKQNSYSGAANGEASTLNPFWTAATMAPIYPVYYRDSTGNKVIDPLTGKDKFDWGNPAKDESSIAERPVNTGLNSLGALPIDENSQKNTNVVAVSYLEARFLKNFTFKTSLNVGFYNANGTSYQSMMHGISKGTGGLSRYTQNDLTYTWNQVLSWSKQLNDVHNLTLMAGHENYDFNTTYVLGSKSGFLSDDFRDLAVGTTAGTITSFTDKDRIESYFASANYDYDAKYYLSANVRRDGSSRFYKDARWGTFWSVGAAWHLNRESFLSDVSWLNLLKLKVSYGTQGNNDLLSGSSSNYYPWMQLYDLTKPNGGLTAAIPNSLANYGLKWEQQRSLNAGIEFTLFNRISGEVNYFNRDNIDLLYNRPLPPSTGFRSRPENVADMYNRGIEVNLNATVARAKDFSWNVNVNLTKMTNKITELAPGLDSVLSGNKMLKPGHSMYEFYLVESAGVDPTNGDELYYYYGSNGETLTTNDYSKAQSARKYVGSAIPKLSGAMTNTVAYKGFELSFLFTFGLGGKYYDGQYQSLVTGGAVASTNWHTDVINNSWTPENTSASLPRLQYDNANFGPSTTSSRFLIDASYLNLRNINLRYSFPTKLAAAAKLQSLSAYVAVDNVNLWSKRKGMNPQGQFNGEDAYYFSPQRTIMFGVNLGL